MFNIGPQPDKGPQQRSVSMPVTSQGVGLGGSIISDDVTIIGQQVTIVSRGKMHIDGDVRGDIAASQVVIGEKGSVTGTVSADEIEVYGSVNGIIRAHTVTLQKTSNVEGDIYHHTLSILEGTHFEGRVRRVKDEGELKPNLDASTYGTAARPEGNAPMRVISAPGTIG